MIAKVHRADEGFTLVEAIVGLVIFLIVAAFMIPMFYQQRLSTINNELVTGAIAVSQQTLDKIRQSDITALPSSGTTITSVSEMGKQYSVSVTYCETTTYCNAITRDIKVQVRHHEQTIYTVKTVYLRLQ